MTFNMYNVSVPVLVRGLQNLSAVLKKGEEQAAGLGLSEAELVGAKLAEDMFPLSRQIQLVSDSAKGVGARLSGSEMPSYEDSETTFSELQSRIAKTIGFLESLDESAFEGSESKEIHMVNKGGEYRFNGQDYLLTFAFPNFFFHVTTAYDILRHKGVQLGKKDYLGAYNA